MLSVHKVGKREEVKARDSCSLHHFLTPVLLNARVLGSLPVDSDWNLRPLASLHTLLVLSLLLVGGSSYSYLSYGVAWNANALTYMSAVLLSVYITAMVALANICNRKKMKDIVRRISAIDDYLWDMGILFRYNRREMVGEVFLRAFFKAVMVVFDWIAYKESISQPSGVLVIVSLYYSYFIIFNIQHQFTAITGSVRKHFSVLNEQCLSLAEDDKTVERMIVAHCHLSECCDVINSWFSPQLLLIASLVFLVSSLNLSAMFMSLISFLDPYPPQITLFISCTLWLTFRLLEMGHIVHLCSAIVTESKSLGQNLSRLVIRKELTLNKPLLKFYLDWNYEVKFTASNFFRIDNTLFISMLSSATTYVVIMVQAQPQMKGVVCLLPSTNYTTTLPNSTA